LQKKNQLYFYCQTGTQTAISETVVKNGTCIARFPTAVWSSSLLIEIGNFKFLNLIQLKKRRKTYSFVDCSHSKYSWN
jgi:hypothetical protein